MLAKRLSVFTAATLVIALMVGCVTQTTLAALTATLGSAAASVATIEGNTVLAQKLTTDTQAAVTAIQQWEPGTSAQNAEQALNLVVADLNLFPITGKYAALITLALTTAESIIAVLNPAVSVSAKTKAAANVPHSAKDFKTAWNQIVANNPDLAAARIK